MGASSSVDEAQFKALQNTVNSQTSKINALSGLESKVDNISNAAASAIDYSKVAEAIDKQTTLRESLATQIAKNPGALADNLAVKIGDQNSAVLLNLNDKLSANSNFQKKIADSISGDSVFKTRIKGDKGEPGTISNLEALKDNLFEQGRTMWCADGDVCQIPPKNNVRLAGAAGAMNVDLGGANGGPNRWILHVPNREGRVLHIASWNKQNNDWDWGSQVNIQPHQLQIGNWRINTGDGHFRVFNGDKQKFVLHAGDGETWFSDIPKGYLNHALGDVKGWARDRFAKRGHQHGNHAPNWETRDTWGGDEMAGW
jgi:hypothetical protein